MSDEKQFQKRLNTLKDHLEKGGQGSGRKNLFDNSKKGEELARSMIKSTPERTQAYLAVLKNINLIEGYVPMIDEDVKKQFEGEIPDVMKSEEHRPPLSWWEAGLKRAASHENDPKAFLIKVWYKAVEVSDEKDDDKKGIGRGGEPRHQNWKHRFGQEISNCSKGLEGEALADAVIKALSKVVEEDEELKKAVPAAAMAALGAAQQVGSGIGEAVNELFTPSGNDTSRKSEETKKAVAVEPEKGTKAATDKRKPVNDEGGESEVTGDPTKGNVADLKPSQQIVTN